MGAAATVSAADANRYFSKLLADVKRGESCVITSHGRAVARLVPIEPEDRTRAAGKAALLARLRDQQPEAAGVRWTRDELYEDA
jgi:prevent-host-death family protein